MATGVCWQNDGLTGGLTTTTGDENEAEDNMADESGHEPILRAGDTCREIATADRVACIVDAADYFLHAKSALLQARRRVILIGWDVDTRISLDPRSSDHEIPRPARRLPRMAHREPAGPRDLRAALEHGCVHRDASRGGGAAVRPGPPHGASSALPDRCRASGVGRTPSEDRGHRRPVRVLRRHRHDRGPLGHLGTSVAQRFPSRPPTVNRMVRGTT